jgi:hypothetical protein
MLSNQMCVEGKQLKKFPFLKQDKKRLYVCVLRDYVNVYFGNSTLDISKGDSYWQR